MNYLFSLNFVRHIALFWIQSIIYIKSIEKFVFFRVLFTSFVPPRFKNLVPAYFCDRRPINVIKIVHP